MHSRLIWKQKSTAYSLIWTGLTFLLLFVGWSETVNENYLRLAKYCSSHRSKLPIRCTNCATIDTSSNHTHDCGRTSHFLLLYSRILYYLPQLSWIHFVIQELWTRILVAFHWSLFCHFLEAQQEAEAKLIQARAQRESASILAEASKAGMKLVMTFEE